jgi:voltage-gated potassium channel
VSFSDTFKSVITRSTLKIFCIFLALILAAATCVFLFEKQNNPNEYHNLWDSVWWVFVTIFTVGYGDIKPITPGGRLVAIFIMLVGVSMVSTITATISSIFVARKIREGQGLESINYENHLIICGWNYRAESLLDTLLQLSSKKDFKLVLLNELDENEIHTILDKYAQYKVKFVRGDYTHAAPLERANIKHAATVLLLPNLYQHSAADADEKTVLATLNIKSSFPKVKVIAFIMNPENEVHVKRAKADEVLVSDKYADYFLASNILQPGLPKVFEQILNPRLDNKIALEVIPARFVGKSYKELFDHYRGQHKELLLGVISQVESIGLSDFLASDTSHIDAFIERKLREAGKSFGEENKVFVKLNPEDDYVIQENEKAVILR